MLPILLAFSLSTTAVIVKPIEEFTPRDEVRMVVDLPTTTMTCVEHLVGLMRAAAVFGQRRLGVTVEVDFEVGTVAFLDEGERRAFLCSPSGLSEFDPWEDAE